MNTKNDTQAQGQKEQPFEGQEHMQNFTPEMQNLLSQASTFMHTFKDTLTEETKGNKSPGYLVVVMQLDTVGEEKEQRRSNVGLAASNISNKDVASLIAELSDRMQVSPKMIQNAMLEHVLGEMDNENPMRGLAALLRMASH